jgi:hypothetical protein
MTDRDHFAAAALTGLLSDKANQYPTALQWGHLLTHAYRWADAMLRERERTDHDAAPAAKARTNAAAGEPGGGAGTGNQTAPPCVETDGPSSAIAQPPASSDGSGEGRPLDVARPDTKGEAAGGRGLNTQEPVAWAVRKQNPPIGESPVLCWYESEMRSVENSLPGCTVIPLYRTPQTCQYVVGKTTQHCSLTPFALTDAEREAIEWAAKQLAYIRADDALATLRSLLERTK